MADDPGAPVAADQVCSMLYGLCSNAGDPFGFPLPAGGLPFCIFC